MTAWRIEDAEGFVIGRIIERHGQIVWHVVYGRAGLDATLDTLLTRLADGTAERIEVRR